MAATSDRGFAERFVFLHGFTQTHHHWHRCAHLISDRCRRPPALAFVDLPGHGLSGSDRTEITSSGQVLVDLAGAGTYVGYSMGGRFGLTAALTGDRALQRLVLIGATPGIEDDDQRAERLLLDGRRADDVESVGVEAFVDEWLAAPMFAGLATDPEALAHRYRNTAAGLAHGLRRCGTGNQPPLWEHLRRVTIPVLVIAGGLDPKFTDIGRRMAGALPNGTFASIDGAGHAAHTERPYATADTIADWLTATG